MNINAIKTRENALTLVDTLKSTPPVAEPDPIKEDASGAAKDQYKRLVEDAKRRNEFCESEASLVEDVKALVKKRIAAIPAEIEVIGIEVSLAAGDIEVISIRLIRHK
jgi:hypothetical protein